MDLEVKRKNSLLSIIAYLVICNIVVIFVASIVKVVCNSFNISLLDQNNYNTASSAINLIVYLIAFGVLGYINYKEAFSDFKTFKEDKSGIGMKILGGYGIFYAINIFCSLMITNIESLANNGYAMFGIYDFITTTADNQSSIEAILKSNGMWMMFISAGFIGPICEELVFRKAFFNLFESKEMGLLVSSLCFALIHITSSFGQFNTISLILMTMPYIFSGFALGYLYIKNDCNIMVPTIVHILSNLISMIGIMVLY
jgi:membrane protease YdiL (CAAX protease family)